MSNNILTFPPLPEISPIPHSESFKGMLAYNGYGQIFAAKNYQDDKPVWKEYKRMAWALKYLGWKKPMNIMFINL